MIGRTPEKGDAYLTRLQAIALETDTHFYFDASFLMWLAKLGPAARGQFFAWRTQVGARRFHVPLWAAHEFFKHRIEDTVAKELKAEIKQFDKASTRLFEAFRSFCSDELFGFEGAGDRFLDDYRRTIQPLRALLALASRSDQVRRAIEEIADFIDAHLLPGPLEPLIANIEADERVRNRGVIPPAFKDAHKRTARKAEAAGPDAAPGGDNSFGDLVFWREVLKHASQVRAGATIILTADRKNDWFENFHGDAGVTPDLRKLMPQPRPVPAPHPLLAREAFDRGAGMLDLIDPPYCALLLLRSGATASAFAPAALDTQLGEIKRPDRETGWARRFGAEARLIGQPASAGGTSAPAPAPAYDLSALTLSAFAARPSDRLAGLLSILAAGDVLARTKALSELDWDLLEGWASDDLALLGRAVTHAATAGDPVTEAFIKTFGAEAPTLSPSVSQPLYFGLLTGLYLDQGGRQLAPTGSPVTPDILDLLMAPDLRPAAEAAHAALASLSLPFVPDPASAPVELTVLTQPSADNKAPADLTAVQLGGTALTTALQTEEELRFSTLLNRPAGVFDIAVGALIDILARYHRLPRQLIKVDVGLDETVRISEYAGVELDL